MTTQTDEVTMEEAEALEIAELSKDPRYLEILKANKLDVPQGEEPKVEKEPKVEAKETVEDLEGEDDEPEGEADPKQGEEQNKEEVDENDPFKQYPKGFAKQLKRERRKAGRLEREVEEMRARLAQIEAAKEQPQKPKERYRKEQFKSEEDYLDYLVNERLQEVAIRTAEEQQKQTALRQQYESLAADWNRKITDNFPDPQSQQEYAKALQELGHPGEVFDQRINEYIFRNPVGPKMLQYLSGRQELIEQLNSMHDWDLAGSLQQIAQYVSARQGSAPAAPRTSKAPAPQGRLGTGKRGATESAEGMSDAELMAYYRKHGRLPEGA